MAPAHKGRLRRARVHDRGRRDWRRAGCSARWWARVCSRWSGRPARGEATRWLGACRVARV